MMYKGYGLEADLVLHLDDGRYVLIECKPGSREKREFGITQCSCRAYQQTAASVIVTKAVISLLVIGCDEVVSSSQPTLSLSVVFLLPFIDFVADVSHLL